MTRIKSGVRFRMPFRYFLYAFLTLFFLAGNHYVPWAQEAKSKAESLLSFKDLRPGLCAYIGADDGDLLAEIAQAGKYHVHALTSDRAKLDPLRQRVVSQGLYGQVVVDYSDLTHLPYADNLINVLLVNDFSALQKKGLTIREIMRVVAPESAAILGNAPDDIGQMLKQAGYMGALIQKKDSWTRIIKPRPEEMDEWPQPDHDAAASSISEDRLVRPPNSVQWITGYPARHDRGLNPLITSDGRIFSSSSDQGIVARDAFNGLKLWQREGASALIATEDRLFVRLEKLGPIVALDPGTGETVKEYSFGSSDKPWPPLSRVAYHEGFLVTGVREIIEAYDVESGEQLWRKKIPGEKAANFSKLALFNDINKKRIIAEGKVFITLSEAKEFLCLDLKTGEELWRVPTKGDRLVSYRNGILFSQYMEKGSNQEEMVFNAAYSARDGKFLWRYDYRKVWHGGHPHNVFLLDGLVWVLVSIPAENVAYTKEPQAWHGLDLETGKLVRSFDWNKIKHRCFPDRATEKYIIAGGMDFLNVETGEHTKFVGGRGNCSFGRMPANGLIYQAPNTCQCFSQVRGFIAFSHNDTSTEPNQDTPPRLKGKGKPADERPSTAWRQQTKK